MESPSPDVVVIGAGMIGAACAYELAKAGLRVVVVDRAGIAGGTSSACEGNILVSDKAPGPELELALRSTVLWAELAGTIGADALEYEEKGGVVVAASPATAAALAGLAAAQRAAGVDVADVGPGRLRELEPLLSPGMAGGAWYRQDAQVQPMLAAASILRAARGRGAILRTGTAVEAITRDPSGRVSGVRTTDSSVPVIHTRFVVNAAGTWAGEVAELAGVTLPILPRRGFILVTEPLPARVIRHKVYTAEYVANVASSAAGLETSVVIEGTRGGTVLIGASRERVGFDRTVSLPALRQLAAKAIGTFPFLADVRLMRTYLGFRPYCPDHLPVIGEDPRAPGLWHACGHEGAGIGLAPATGRLVAQGITGGPTLVDPRPFRPERFEDAAA